MINEISDFVENACKSEKNTFGYGIWSHHIRPMVGIARELAHECGADEEIVIISTLLHDIAGIEDQNKIEEHHVYGAERAEEILAKYGLEDKMVSQIKKCIYNHRGSINNPKGTLEEICVADADAIAHIQEIGALFYVAYVEKGLGIDEGIAWIQGKMERDWNKMSERGKVKFKTRFDDINRVISTNA
jgi:uncharacterized protein